MLTGAVIVQEYDFAYAYCAATGCTMDEYYDNVITCFHVSESSAVLHNKLGNVFCESFNDSIGDVYMKVYPIKGAK